MTVVLKASDWPNGQLSSVMQFDSHEAFCMYALVYAYIHNLCMHDI